MNSVLLRNASRCAHRFLLSPAALKPCLSTLSVSVPLAGWILLRFRFFSLENDSTTEAPAFALEAGLVPTESEEASLDMPDISKKRCKSAANAELFPRKGYFLDALPIHSAVFAPS